MKLALAKNGFRSPCKHVTVPPMKRFVPFLALIGLALATVLPAADHAAYFLAPGAVDAKAVLPLPPAVGSLAALGDLEAVRQAQVARTPEDVAWAKSVEKDQAFGCAAVLGPWFTPENLPQTAEFLKRVSADTEMASHSAKGLFSRPRPPLTDPTLQPCVDLPGTGSFPSGHSMRAFVWALVLSDIFPEQREALLARAHRVAWGRVMGGVHYPTDVVGGRMLGEAIAAALRKSPVYQAEVEKCRAEAAPFLLKKAA